MIAFISMLLISFGLAFVIQYFGDMTYKVALTNAIPFAIISSAIAIPRANRLTKKHKEFITYESSFSDIFGVIF
jgi:potassium/hydrogen antiporter